MTSRLTDPANFPPAYRNKLEAIKRHQQLVASQGLTPLNKKTASKASLQNLSSVTSIDYVIYELMHVLIEI